MSGITFLSCLLMIPDRNELPPLVSAMLDIQACASVLEALSGEYNPSGEISMD